MQWAQKNITSEQLSNIQQRPAMRMGPANPLNPISPEEITSAIQKLKKGKAPGHDALTPDMLIALDMFGETKLLQLLNQCMENCNCSLYLQRERARPRPCFLPTYFLTPRPLQSLRVNPTTAAKSTTQPLFLVRRLQDWSRALDKPVHLLFLDWKQAFDTIDHSALIAALKRWNLHEGYIEIIQDFYTNPQFSTVGMNGAQAYGQASSGIRQGCPLSPYLFILLRTVLMHDTENRLLRTGTPTNTWSVGKPIFDIEYADDTLLFGITTPQLESMLHALEHEAVVYGLILNMSKSERLIQPGQEGNNIVFRSGDPVPTTTCSKYSGSQITWQKPTDTVLTARFRLASAAYKSLVPFGTAGYLSASNSVFSSLLLSLPHASQAFQKTQQHLLSVTPPRSWGESSLYFACRKYYSLGTSRAPHNTSPTNSPTANQTFIDMLGYSAERPFPSHCVLFSLERPSRMQQKIIPGKTSTPHWFSLMLDCLQLPINHFFPHHPQITNPMTLQQLINKTPRLTGFLVAAPTLRISVSFSPACQTGAAARRARVKKSILWKVDSAAKNM